MPARGSTLLPYYSLNTSASSSLAPRPRCPSPAIATPALLQLRRTHSPVCSSASTEAPSAPTRKAAPLQPPYNVLVTGSTKGVSFFGSRVQEPKSSCPLRRLPLLGG
eukprot:786228-Pelagomonas_calceolata.AAC.2